MSSTDEPARAATALSPTFVRRPYYGSCHCKNVKYVTWIHLPEGGSSAESLASDQPVPKFADTDVKKFIEATGQEIYKCNCTTCHKLGHFHLRLADSPRDFLLLRPLAEPGQSDSGLTPYVIPKGNTKWYFCSRCGTRLFSIRGEFERVDGVKVPAKALAEMGLESEGHVVDGPGSESSAERVVSGWSPKSEGWEEDGEARTSYFSLNLITVDAAQEGFDLREIHERGWVQYLDAIDYMPEERTTRPHQHGMY